jgi:hypothetical protein
MDRKTLTIVLAVALIASFFLPMAKIGGSMLDVVQAKGGDWKKYLLLVYPICGILLLIGALNGNYVLSRSLLTWLPFLTFLLMHFILPLVDGVKVDMLFQQFKGFGIGLWLAFVSSLVLAFYNPRA